MRERERERERLPPMGLLDSFSEVLLVLYRLGRVVGRGGKI